MLSFLRRRWFLTLLGFLLLALFIGYLGPYFAFADYRPLESATARIILFFLIVGVWAIGRLLKKLRAYRASDRLVAAVVRQAPPDEGRPSAEAAQLRERFEQAVATLKGSRRSGHSLYDLPWYVIIGAPGSGKTTALLNSGLKFPLEQRVGKGALRGVGGTRNCDWWFTDEAVFLDTAGRYTTQDSDAASDSAGWSEFLALLKKYRKRRPVNGVILTISAQDLMVQGDRGREGHVEAARRRLNELNRELQIQLPVYVMVTKCDLVAGFSEYFDDLAQDGRAQVWGVTFPYEQTLNGEATTTFPAEFDQLMARLNARVYPRVEEDRDVRRRSRIFAFPQQMAALRDILTQFVSEVFASTRLDQQILLRGVYFTSGTQEGTPIDRLLGAIGRRYGVAPEAVVPATGRGKAYFVERLLKEVLIGESGLAGVNRRLEMQKAALQLGAYAAMAAIAVGGLLAFSVSYGRNRAYITETTAELAKLDQVPPVGPRARLEALLPRLDTLRGIVDAANKYEDDPPWAMRWGLYQGRAVGNAARDAYLRELDGTLLPRVAARIEERLGQFAPEPEKLYEYLKAYLMIGEPQHLRKDHLQFVADLEWNAADNADPDAAASLSRHFRSLLDHSETLRPIAMNPDLLAQARSTVRQASIPRLVYSRLKRTHREDSARAVQLDLAAGVGAERVIRRRSGKSLSEPVPSLFTRPVFQEIVSRRIPQLVKDFAADDWVWGDEDGSSRVTARLSSEVTELYERDYIDVWDGIVNDIEFVPFSSAEQTIEALGLLSAPASPLRGLFGAIADNTNLIATEPPKPSAGEAVASGAAAAARKKLEELAGRVPDQLGGLFGTSKGGKPPSLPGALVTAHFQEIHRLMAGEPGNAPIDRLLRSMGQVQHHLRSMGTGSAVDLSDPVLRDLLQSLQQEAATLPPVVQGLATQVGRKAEGTLLAGVTTNLESRYRDEVVRECSRFLPDRYPFTPSSRTDLPLRDFAYLFGVGGVFDKFFQENLRQIVDRSRSPWTWRGGASYGPRAILDHLEKADEIRQLFFHQGSNALEQKFHLTIEHSDATSIRFVVEIDGQPFEYRSPPKPTLVLWPSGKPESAAASVTWHEPYGGLPRISHIGPWAWFRLLDAGRLERESDTRGRFSYQLKSHTARLMVEALSIQNPFFNREWQRFTCTF
jgi:type VI secretion system protein ImpL